MSLNTVTPDAKLRACETYTLQLGDNVMVKLPLNVVPVPKNVCRRTRLTLVRADAPSSSDALIHSVEPVSRVPEKAVGVPQTASLSVGRPVIATVRDRPASTSVTVTWSPATTGTPEIIANPCAAAVAMTAPSRRSSTL